jgi:TPP-dependent pyruvate/acetoin dehydrogenase alpha subunit
MALAEKLQGSQVVTIAFLGDGTLGEGVVYETLNIAALWRAPILFVLENNRIAQTTPIEQAVAGSLLRRFQAFSIPAWELDSSDVEEIASVAEPLLEDVRQEAAPCALILHTCRFGPHSKGDDTRPVEEVERMRQERDPLSIQAARLEPDRRNSIAAGIDEEIQRAFQLALADPYPIP